MHYRSSTNTMSRAYQACYPIGVTSYIEEAEAAEDVHDVFLDLEQERLAQLLTALRSSVFRQVLRRVEKVAERDEVAIPPATTVAILQELVAQGEREICGVRGGTLVVQFTDRAGKVHKIGRFPLDPYTTSTYQLHLHLRENANFKTSVENLVRKMSGHGPLTLISPNYTLEVKKLYRSSTSSI